ncbi:CaiB/BaiF CoA transferase family protein [Chloroflexota bacterium]
MALPLSGIRVADLSHAIAGSCGSMILGDQGAEVIKVEPPEGDESRLVAGPGHNGHSFYFLAFNRNKKSLVLDISTETGKQAFYDLVKASDVVYDNFRPGVMERLGADYETLKKINPGIITCSISGYGSSGPYSHKPAYDVVGLAETGFLSITGEPGGPPIKPGEAIGDIATGMFAAIGILAALNKRNVTGKGSEVEVSIFSSVMALLNYSFSYYFCSGIVPKAMGTHHLGLMPYGVYKTRDSYVAVGPCWPRIARAVDAEWMIEDPRFKDRPDRIKNREELKAILEERLSHADTKDWLNIFEVEDVAAGPVNTLDEALEHPQVKEQNLVLQMEHPSGGQIKLIGNPIQMTDSFVDDYIPPPIIGQHTHEILTNILGYSEEQISKLQKEQEENTEVRLTHVFKGKE